VVKGINVVIKDEKNRILVMKRSVHVKFSPNLWDFPGGHVEEGESLIGAVMREAKEEAGLEVETENNPFYVFPYPNTDITIYAFLAKSIMGEVKLSEEHTEYKWISKEDWRDLDYSPSTQATLEEFFKDRI
jgi:8-oxo-dGTP diphosphatase